MTRTRTIAISALIGALAACASSAPMGSESPTQTATPTPTETASAQGALVVYATALAAVQDEPGFNDVWLYDASTDQTRRLTHTGDERHEGRVVFRDRSRVAFVASSDRQDTLFELDVETGEERVLLEPKRDEIIWSLDWDPAGARLAVLQNRKDHKVVRILDATTGEMQSIYRLPGNVGRGGETADEIAATWSPDGTMLAVVDTAGDYDTADDSEPPITVIAPNGDVIVDGISGTMARWSPDSKYLYFRSMYAADRSRWSVLDVSAETTERLEVSARHQLYPAVSPDGRSLAFSDSEPDGKVRIVDLDSGEERVVARDAVGPIWLSDTTLAVTDVEPCVEHCGEGPQWRIAARARLIDVADGSESRARLHHTGALGGAADVLL